MPSVADLLVQIEYYFSIWGIWIIPLAAFLENSIILGFIFPGVSAIFLAGFLARTSGENLALIIGLAALGSFLGDNFDYFIGKNTGNLLSKKPLFARPIKRVSPLLHKHGVWAIFLGRFSAWSRAWIAMVSGIVGIVYWKFALVSLISAISWTGAWVIGGYLLGANRELIEDFLGRASIAAWGILLAILVYYFRTRIKLVLDLIAIFGKKYTIAAKNRLPRR